MRNYKGKRIDNGEWVYGWYVPVGGNENGRIDHYIFTNPEYDATGLDDCVAYIKNMAEVIPETVGQSIGLIDKNDTEIYEGDIVKCYKKYDTLNDTGESYWKEGYAEAVIEFSGLSFIFQQRSGSEWFFYGPESREFHPEWFGKDHDSKDEWIEVIGNIYKEKE